MTHYQELSEQIEHGTGVPEPIKATYYKALDLIHIAERWQAYWFRNEPGTKTMSLIADTDKARREAEADPNNYYGIWYPKVSHSTAQELAVAIAIAFNPEA